MKRIFKIALIGLLAFALPLQGVAAGVCAPPGAAHGAMVVMSDAGTAANLNPLPNAEAAPSQHDSCNGCATCDAGVVAFLPTELSLLSAGDTPAHAITIPVASFAGFVSPRLERPPRPPFPQLA